MANIQAPADHPLTIDVELATIPRAIAAWGSRDQARGDFVAGMRMVPFYYGDGALWFIMDRETCKRVALPPAPKPAGPPPPPWMSIDRIAKTEAHKHRVVYFIGTVETAIKIGVSYSAEARCKTLQAHSPIPLEILAVRQGSEGTEGAYHDWFAAHRLHGEWFNPAPEILAEIERLRASGEGASHV